MSDNAVFGIAVTASDKTAAGVKSAEKSLGRIPKKVGEVNKRALADTEKSAVRSGGGILRSFASIEKAGAKVFGGKSLTSGIVSRLGAVKEAASAAGDGLGEAAVSGGVLEGALGTLGIVAGATVGILAAAGYAAFKLADGWAKGAASIGRTSDVIGVATKQLQEFQAAGERAGVDRGASTSALGGIAQTLNDARYGRNQEALALMMRMGVKFKTGADGQLDTSAMTLDLADAIARQKNAQTRRMIAGKFGISDAALPMFLQGSGQLKADMADAGKHAGVLSDEDVRRGKRIVRNDAIIGQMKDRAMMRAGAFTAKGEEITQQAIIDGGRAIMDGGGSFRQSVRDDFAPAAKTIARAADKIWNSVGSTVSSIGRGVIGVTRDIISAAQAAERRYGIPAAITLGQYGLESGFGRHMPAGSNNPFGIKARAGEPFVWAKTHEQDRFGNSYATMGKFRVFSSLEEAFDAHARLLMARPYAAARRELPSVDRFADALTGTYATDRRYGSKLRNVIHKNGLERYDRDIPVKVEIDMRGAPPGTKAKVTAGRSSQPAVSHAFAF